MFAIFHLMTSGCQLVQAGSRDRKPLFLVKKGAEVNWGMETTIAVERNSFPCLFHVNAMNSVLHRSAARLNSSVERAYPPVGRSSTKPTRWMVSTAVRRVTAERQNVPGFPSP